MFMHFHAAEFETASLRARQRWADHIDGLLGERCDRPEALREVHDILVDPNVAVRTEDLHDLVASIRRGTPDSLDAFVASYRHPA